jgi:signal transduction histidine kinase
MVRLALNALLLLCGLLPLLVQAQTPPQTPPQTQTQAAALTQAWVSEGDQGAATSPGPWKPVTLPDHWGLAQRTGTWTYRLALGDCTRPLPACTVSGRQLALWVPKVGNSMDVWFNGAKVVSLGTVNGHTIDYAVRPILIQVAPAWLRPQGNEVRLVVSGHPGLLSGLSRVWFGDFADLAFAHLTLDYFIVGGPTAVIVVSLLFSVAGLLSWVRTRHVATWLFTASGLSWAAREVIQLTGVRIMPLDTALVLALALKGTSMLLAGILLLRLMGVRSRLLHGLLLAQLACAPLLLAQGLMGQGMSWLEPWHTVVQLTLLTLVLVPVRVCWHKPSVTHILILVGCLGCVAIGLIDGWYFYLSGKPEGFEHVPLTSHMAAFFLLSVSASMFVRVDHALRLEVAHKDALEREVQAQRAELQALHARESERLQREAVVSERARIIRDMHDGLGSQLVGLLSTVQSGEYTQAELTSEVHEAIDQLRLTIDTLEPLGNDLSSLLGQLRFRLESRLRKIGFQVDWRVDNLPGGDTLGAQGLTSLQRLLYEVFSNIMKHARAQRVVVRGVHDAQRGLNQITITDDGQGFDPLRDTPGRGLRNMRVRAAQLGAVFDIRSEPGGGTCVSVSLPCKPLAA